MSNVHRLRHSDKIFFVTSNLLSDRRHLEEKEYSLILQVIQQLRVKMGFLFCGYVLMPDHWHALIWVGYPMTLSEVMGKIKVTSSGRLNKHRGTQGANWQHQFWDRFVRDADEFDERLKYMHLNPVRRGLVERPEAWPWSSINNFSLDPVVVAACPIQTDYIQLPDSYRA